jgi:hypothetical protein
MPALRPGWDYTTGLGTPDITAFANGRLIRRRRIRRARRVPNELATIV